MTDDSNNDAPEEIAGEAAEAGGFDDFESGAAGAKSFKEMWDKPAFKISVLIGGLALVIILMIMFGGQAKPIPHSTVADGSELKQAPGTAEVSKVYAEALQEKNTEVAENAQKTGQSAIPVPISTAKEPVAIPEEQTTAEDPLARWRSIQEERIKRDVAAKKPDLPAEDANAEAITALSGAMSKQMSSLLKDVKSNKIQYKLVISDQAYEDQAKAKQKTQDEGAGKAPGITSGQGQLSQQQTANIMDVLVPAGTIEYAQLITQANSDTPGPVLAQIVSGPLAGSRILGTFQTEEDHLVLTFDTVVIHGLSQGISAVALDPNTATNALATSVDHRYWERVILPAASAFLQGIGSGIAQTGSTTSQSASTTTTSSPALDPKQYVAQGVSAAATKVGSILDESGGATKTLVIVAAGTPMGLLFLAPVTKPAGGTQQQALQQ